MKAMKKTKENEEVTIINISDTSDDESKKALKARKAKEAKVELANAIKDGRWLRSDQVAALSKYEWIKASTGSKGLFIHDNVVIITSPLKTPAQFVGFAKEFKKWTYEKFQYLSVIIYKDAHFSMFLFCNETIEGFSRKTTIVHIDPLHLHDSKDLQRFITR